MDINSWYLIALVLAIIYIIPVLIIRIGLNRRKDNRRIKDRRVSFQHVPIERRKNNYDRRAANRVGLAS